MFRIRHALSATMTVAAASLFLTAGCGGNSVEPGLPLGKTNVDQVLRGRKLVTSTGCADCHNRGVSNPADHKWLAGFVGTSADQGPGAFNLGPSARSFAANITPDATHGIGGFTARQLYNALKYGLDPEHTPDVVITGTTPGAGNFPADPHYLAPPMPWYSIRHSDDEDIWAIVAYLKHGAKANSNEAPESSDTPDHWAGASSEAAVGPANLPSFPTASEALNP